jgi:hypothetical protein
VADVAAEVSALDRPTCSHALDTIVNAILGLGPEPAGEVGFILMAQSEHACRAIGRIVSERVAGRSSSPEACEPHQDLVIDPAGTTEVPQCWSPNLAQKEIFGA